MHFMKTMVCEQNNCSAITALHHSFVVPALLVEVAVRLSRASHVYHLFNRFAASGRAYRLYANRARVPFRLEFHSLVMVQLNRYRDNRCRLEKRKS